ncbi:MAG TPA: NAD-dependent epimerase/dehydratase family protein, partial [Devosia sp.]|nr:NAD-dependent epimerase/dehydratase family protein [Devosia sp.]
MKILVIGAAGMVGRKLTAALLQAGSIGERRIDAMILADVVAPVAPQAALPIQTIAADLSVPGIAEQLLAERPEVIFH